MWLKSSRRCSWWSSISALDPEKRLLKDVFVRKERGGKGIITSDQTMWSEGVRNNPFPCPIPFSWLLGDSTEVFHESEAVPQGLF